MQTNLSNLFIGREWELKQLRGLKKTPESKIAILYGRRRVGKTFLIREAFKTERTFFFEGIEDQSKQKQIQSFLFQLKQQASDSGLDLVIDFKASSWQEALIQLRPLCVSVGGQKIVLVLDEFQWMASFRSELISELKMVWEQYLSKNSSILLILCGSIASFMIEKVVRSKALYGRIALEIRLTPFQLQEAAELLSGHGKAEVLESLLLVGGIPLYLKMLKEFSSIYLGLDALAFKPNGYFLSEFGRIFISHFGKNDHYEKIIRALNQKPNGMFREDLAKVCNVELSGHLSEELANLELAGFIKSFTPIDKPANSKIKKYLLTDPYILFYLSFIAPNLKKITDQQLSGLFLRISQSAKFYAYLGRLFELFCINHSKQVSTLLGFSGIEYTTGPYFRKSLQGVGTQIDLLFDRQDHVMTLCEIKYSRSPTGVEVIPEVEQKVSVLSQISNKTIQKVLIVKDAVTADLVRKGYFYRIIRSDEFF